MATASPFAEKMQTYRYQDIVRGPGKRVMATIVKVVLEESSTTAAPTSSSATSASTSSSATAASTSSSATAASTSSSATAASTSSSATAASTSSSATAGSASSSTTATPTSSSATAAQTSSSATAAPTSSSATATPTSSSATATLTSSSATAAPTSCSVTAAPTSSSATAAPTSSSATASLTSSSATAAPTSSSSTAAPTSSSATTAPTSSSATAAPTSSSTTAAPTSTSATAAPTSSSATAAPTSSSTTAGSTSSSATAALTSSSVTAGSTSSSSTAALTSSSATAAQTSSSATAAPTSSSTTAAPTSSSATAALTSSSATAAPTSSTATAAPTSNDAQLLKDVGVYKKLKLKDRQKIDNEDLTNQDITYIFNVFFEFCKLKDFPHGKLKDLLKKIKDQRNEVSHEESKLTVHELEDKLKVFLATLRETIDETETLYPSHSITFATLKGDVDQAFSDILKEKIREELNPLSPVDRKRHMEEHVKFGNQYQAHIQTESKSALANVVKRECRTMPFDWITTSSPVDPSNISVALNIAKENELHGILSPHKPESIDQKSILEVKGPTGDEAEVAIVSAEAGAGKTTLLRLIAEKWYKEETGDFPGLSNYLLVFYIEFRKSNFNCFDDYIKNRLQHVVADNGFDNVKSSIMRSQCLFLCDGYDERNESSLCLFEEILDLQSKDKKVVVTSRPINTQDLTDMVNKSGHSRVNLNLLGIPEEAIVQSIKNIVNLYVRDADENKETVTRITESINLMKPEMKQFMRIPLYNNLIIRLLIHCPEMKDSINTVTKIFEEMKKHEVKRFVYKIGDKTKEISVRNFQKLYNFRCLRDHLVHKHELKKEDIETLKEECRKLELPFEEVVSSFFGTKHSLNDQDIEQILCYKHRTEQEFGAAHAICEMLNNSDGRHDCIHKECSENIIIHYLRNLQPQMKDKFEDICKNLQNIMPFVTGILVNLNLVERYINQVIEIVYLNKGYVIDPVLRILSESDNNSEVLDAIAVRLQKERSDIWQINNGKHLSSVSALLSKTKPDKCILDMREDTPPELIPTIRNLSLRQVNLRLRLMHHYHNGSDYSDTIIKETSFLKEFCGNLRNLSLIPEEIEILFLRSNFQGKGNLQEINGRLPSLKELVLFGLWIPFRELPTEDRISPLKFTGKRLFIWIDLEGGGGDSDAHCSAEITNKIWPRVTKKWKRFLPKKLQRLLPDTAGNEMRCEGEDQIIIWNSSFSKSGVEEFLNTLKMKSLEQVYIDGTVGLTDTDKGGLRELCSHKGFGDLKLQ